MNKKKTSAKTTSKKIDPLLLEEALYKAEDDFDKAVCKFMIVGKTLKSIKKNLVIGGDKVELGVLERRLTKEVRGWFKEWGWKIDRYKMTTEHKGIPIEVKIIKKVKLPYKDPDVMHYKVAYYETPNPWRLGV